MSTNKMIKYKMNGFIFIKANMFNLIERKYYILKFMFVSTF